MRISQFPKESFFSPIVFLLLTLLFGNSFFHASETQAKTALDLKNEGVELYISGDYVRAIETLEQVFLRTKEKSILSRVQLYLSMSYYCLGESEKAHKWLNASLDMQPNIDIREIVLPRGYAEIYQKARTAKYGPHKEGPGETEKPVVKTAPSAAPKSRKSGFLLIAGGVLIGGGIAVALLAGGKDSDLPMPTHGSIKVNSNPIGAKIYHNGEDTGRMTNNILTMVTPGKHTIKVVKEGYAEAEEEVEVKAGETVSVSFDLTGYTITVTSPAAGDVWVSGQEREIRWEWGQEAVLHAAISLDSRYSDAGTYNNALAAQRASIREQALLRRTDGGRSPVRGGIAEDHISGESPPSFHGRRDSRSDATSQPGGFQGASGAAHAAAEHEASDLSGNRMRWGFVWPDTSGFSASLTSEKRKPRGDSHILMLSKVRIALYKGSIKIFDIVEREENSESFKWTIPSSLIEGEDYKIRVSCADDEDIYGESEMFTIKKATE